MILISNYESIFRHAERSRSMAEVKDISLKRKAKSLKLKALS